MAVMIHVKACGHKSRFIYTHINGTTQTMEEDGCAWHAIDQEPQINCSRKGVKDKPKSKSKLIFHSTEPAMTTYLQLLPADVVARELAPILARCERPPILPPRITLGAKITIWAFAVTILTLALVIVSVAWPIDLVEDTCVPFVCDWVAMPYPWGDTRTSACGHCDNVTANCYWAAVVNGYVASEPWGGFRYDFNGPVWVCPNYAPYGQPSLYYNSTPPSTNGTICYKPSQECTGEDWVTNFVNYHGWCSPVFECNSTGKKVYKHGFTRILFIILSSLVLASIAIASGVFAFSK